MPPMMLFDVLCKYRSDMCGRSLTSANAVLAPCSGEISMPEWNFLVRGATTMVGIPTRANPAPSWITEMIWNGVLYAEHNIPTLAGLADSITNQTAEWKKW